MDCASGLSQLRFWRSCYTIVFFALLASVPSRAAPPNTDLDRCESLIAQGARLLAERPSIDVSELDHEGLPRTDNARGHHEMTQRAHALWKRASAVCLDVAEKSEDRDTALRGLTRGYWIQGQWHAAEKRRGAAIETYETGIARGENFAAEKGLDRRHLVPLYEALADLVWRERGDFPEAHTWIDRALVARRDGGWLIRHGRIEESRELRDLEQALLKDASPEP